MIGTNGGHYIELANSEAAVNITAKAGYVGGLIGAAGGD